MQKLAFDEVPAEEGRSADVTRDIGSALDVSDMGMQYYELDPGEYIARTYHMHEDQEEVFITLEGVATFETDDGDKTVEAGELIKFDRGDYQRGRNASDERAVVLGLGAPSDPSYEHAERLRYCEECAEMTPQQNAERPNGIATECEFCGAETGFWA